MRSVYKQRDKLKLPSLTYTETRALTNSICVALNSIPVMFNATAGAPVAPVHFRAPYTLRKVESGSGSSEIQNKDPPLPLDENPKEVFERVSSLQSNLHTLHQMLGEKNQVLVKVLKENYSLSSHRFLQNKSKVHFQENDVILVLKATGCYFGLVLEAHPNHARVRLADQSPPREIDVHYKNCILIYRQSADPSLERSPDPTHPVEIPPTPGSNRTSDPPRQAGPGANSRSKKQNETSARRRSPRLQNASCRVALISKAPFRHAMVELF